MLSDDRQTALTMSTQINLHSTIFLKKKNLESTEKCKDEDDTRKLEALKNAIPEHQG